MCAGTFSAWSSIDLFKENDAELYSVAFPDPPGAGGADRAARHGGAGQ